MLQTGSKSRVSDRGDAFRPESPAWAPPEQRFF
jgi:hypothetical protein